jgi:hypothetical protein
MKKLTLESLTVDSFPTQSATGAARGTVAGHEEALDTTVHCVESYDCPDSYNGTCWISCWETCPCTGGPDCA